MTTDIVVTTCERLPLLKRTLAHIWERTITPYRLHVIDDASANADYITVLRDEGRVASVLLRPQRAGISANLRAISRITVSDPVVFTDDDALCPKLDPDWLARGLAAMRQFPKVGLLTLNNPQCAMDSKRGKETPGDPVTLCRNVSGQFVFVRRAVLTTCHPPDGVRSPVKVLCRMARAHGWQVGYLTHVYCQHIGSRSVRTGKNLSRLFEWVPPVDDDTLEPPEEFRR
ncbi:MAG TPA: glycosyltransferase [Planctomycetota bacterium]|nr:glycosyltransferase [Planctomycetota bacterium]